MRTIDQFAKRGLKTGFLLGSSYAKGYHTGVSFLVLWISSWREVVKMGGRPNEKGVDLGLSRSLRKIVAVFFED